MKASLSGSAELEAARSTYQKAELRFRRALDIMTELRPCNSGLVLAGAVAARNRAFDNYQMALKRFVANRGHGSTLRSRNRAASRGGDVPVCSR